MLFRESFPKAALTASSPTWSTFTIDCPPIEPVPAVGIVKKCILYASIDRRLTPSEAIVPTSNSLSTVR